MIVVIGTVISSAFYTNHTLLLIEKNLPNTLLTELNLLSSALEKFSDVVTAAKIAKEVRSDQSISALKEKLEISKDYVAELRETYVLDNLVNASRFHSVIAPVIADLQTWLTEGVSGYGPKSEITLNIIELRASEAYQKARELNSQSRMKAEAILNNQKKRLEQLQKGVGTLFVLTLLVVCFLIFLLFRQTFLIRRERVTKHALSNQNDLLENLLKNIPLGIAVWNKRKEIIHLNKKFTEITGYDQADLPSLTLWPGLAYPDPAYRRKVKEHWLRLDKSRNVGEYEVTCKDGQVKDIEFRATFLADFRVINTLTDVTERNRREQALRESRKIEARSKKMESLGLLAGGVAHDLNNILSGIVSYPDLILLELAEEDKIRKSIEIIRDSGQKAAAIVQDLLTVARGVAIPKEPLNLNDVVNEYFDSPPFKLLKQHQPKVSFEVSLDEQLKNVMGSKVHLQKILMNLVSNGSESIEDTGKVMVSTAGFNMDNPFQGYDEVEEGEYIILSVTDQGEEFPTPILREYLSHFIPKK